MIHPGTRDVFNFLWNHLDQDLRVLGKTLDQNMDNTAVTVHLILTTCTEPAAGDTDSPTTFSIHCFYCPRDKHVTRLC